MFEVNKETVIGSSTQSATDDTVSDVTSTKKPKNVPTHLWEKFKTLEKRTNETTKRSTEKRIKHLQQKVLAKVSKELSSPEDQDILKEHDVKFESPKENTRKRKSPYSMEVSSVSNAGSSHLTEEKDEIMKLMSVNDHLVTTDHSRPPPETTLEKRIAEAIEKGDLNTAESLSDKLATLQAGEKLAAAFDARNYLQEKQKEKETLCMKKRKKLHWGFEPKQRWETKGNM